MDEKLKKKETISILFGVWCVLTVIGFNYLLGLILPNDNNKALIEYIGNMIIGLLFISGYLFYFWKSDMAELLKRLRLAVPFSLMVSIFTIAMGLGNRAGIGAGLFVFVLLLLKTPDRKQHFTVIMTLALTALIALKFSNFLSPAEDQKDSLLNIALSFVGTVPIALFFSFYISKVIKGRQFTVSSVMFKVLKFFITISVFLSLFMLLAILGKGWGITLPVQLLASIILSIIFVVVCYKLGLHPFRPKDKEN